MNGGYRKVNLYDKRGKCSKKYVHRLVAEAFIPNPENKPNVNHIDCNRQNNKASNLEWCTQSENIKHAVKCGTYVSNLSNVRGVMPNVQDNFIPTSGKNTESVKGSQKGCILS